MTLKVIIIHLWSVPILFKIVFLQPKKISMADYHHNPDANNRDRGDVTYASSRKGSSVSRTSHQRMCQEPHTWTEVWYDFTQTTTLHGVSRITEPTPFILRRMFWVLIVMCGFGLFTYQLVASIMLFFTRPVAVNIRINYEHNIPFPAITICNLNAFRASQAYAQGYYESLYNVYVHDNKIEHNNTNLVRDDLDLQLIHSTLAHAKDDLIVSCEWQNRPCKADDFQAIMTNHGLCFTFNGGNSTGKNGEIYHTTHSGVGSGVKLRLNVEQYEYMPGPNSGAGVKILVHNQTDVPMVKQMGQDVPPGSNGLVGIQITKITNLQPPYGMCQHGDLKMRYFPFYSHASCMMECEEQNLVRLCNCRMHFMPELYPADFYSIRDGMCHCPVPCNFDIYDSFISYGHISRYDTEQILYQETGRHLTHRYSWAREVTQRVDKNIKKFDNELVDAMTFGKDLIQIEVEQLVHLVEDSLEECYASRAKIATRLRFHGDYVLGSLNDMLEYGFLGSFEMLVRTTQRFLTAYDSVFAKYEALLEDANATGIISTSSLHNLQMNVVSSFLHIARDADHIHALLRDLNESVHTGESLRDKPTYRDFLTVTNRAIISKDFDETLIPWFFLNKFGQGTIGERIIGMGMQVMNKVKSFFDAFDTSTMQNIIFANYTRTQHKVNVAFSFLKHFNTYLSMRIKDSRVYVANHRNQYSLDMSMVRQISDSLNVTLWRTVKPKTLQILDRLTEIQNVLNLSKNYLNGSSFNKSDLAAVVTSDDFAWTLESMQSLELDVSDGARTMERDYPKYKEIYEEKWYMVASNNITDAFYHKLLSLRPLLLSNQTRLNKLARNLGVNTSSPTDMQMFHDFINTDITSNDPHRELQNIELIMMRLFHQMNMDRSSGAEWRRFLENLKKWKASLQEFLDGSRIDANFFRDNFLDIEVFMKELYYEEIEQRVAYDLTSLFSDIGGSLGLFVGASVITLFEIMDTIAHNVAKVHFT